MRTNNGGEDTSHDISEFLEDSNTPLVNMSKYAKTKWSSPKKEQTPSKNLSKLESRKKISLENFGRKL